MSSTSSDLRVLDRLMDWTNFSFLFSLRIYSKAKSAYELGLVSALVLESCLGLGTGLNYLTYTFWRLVFLLLATA